MPKFRVPIFGRALRVPAVIPQQAQQDAQDFKLIRCGSCRSPLGRMASGSYATMKCRHCNALVRVEVH
jgi:hypothetical protein